MTMLWKKYYRLRYLNLPTPDDALYFDRYNAKQRFLCLSQRERLPPSRESSDLNIITSDSTFKRLRAKPGWQRSRSEKALRRFPKRAASRGPHQGKEK